MAKIYDVTLTVQSDVLFDTLNRMKGDTSALGQRLVEVLLAPENASAITQIGMSIYGVTIKDVKETL